jgi:hypothetical protein
VTSAKTNGLAAIEMVGCNASGPKEDNNYLQPDWSRGGPDWLADAAKSHARPLAVARAAAGHTSDAAMTCGNAVVELQAHTVDACKMYT